MNRPIVIAYLGIGTNLGDRESNIINAVKHIDSGDMVQVLDVSSLYESKPVGMLDQPDFLNIVLSVKTSLEPRELLEFCLGIENEMRRVRTVRWGPRVIDIDILYYDNICINEDDLIIPHPRLKERLFVTLPLLEISDKAGFEKITFDSDEIWIVGKLDWI